MSAPWHIVMIIPVAYRDAINKCGAALNYGWTNFTMELVTPPDMETVTHYACDAPASDGFKALIEQAHIGNLPAGIVWEDFDLTEAEATAAFANAIFDAAEYPTGAELERFNEVIAGLGLSQKAEPGI